MFAAPLALLFLSLSLVPAASESDDGGLQAGLSLLAQGVAQQQELELWTDVIPSTRMAKTILARAGAIGVGEGVRAAHAGYVTADAVAGWQQLLMNANRGDVSVTEVGGDGPAVEDVVALLESAEGTLAVTSAMLVNVLFEIQDDQAAADALLRGLVRFDEDDGLHAVARQWAEFHPAPEAVVELLDRRLAAHADRGAIGATQAARIGVTRARFRSAHAGGAFAANNLTLSAELYQEAAHDFRQADVLDPALDSFALASRGAQSWTWAGWSHYYQAVNAVASEASALSDAERTAGSVEVTEFSVGNDLIIAHLTEAERCFGAALRTRRGDEASTLGMGYVGNFYKDNLGDDLTREFFARVAPRSDNAAWWNNLGLLCRDTGTTAEELGNEQRARDLYESAYHAYTRCIELSPDNARWVNDTGLMLYYHLGRELDLAERHFLHAWEHGREVCDNPFADQDIFDENFAAYTDAMLNLARLYHEQGRLERAEEIAVELVEAAPERPDAQMTLRVIRATQGS